MQDSPLTPNTEHSPFSLPEDQWPAVSQLYQPTSLTCDGYAKNTEAWARPCTLTRQLDIAANTTDDLPPTCEHQGENNTLDPTGAPSVAKVESKPSNARRQNPAPIVKRKGKKKAPSLMTRRLPAKTRQQRLSDNKAAAFKCRHQRKACEMQLQETSLMLQTSIKVSESNINELGIELASLRRNSGSALTARIAISTILGRSQTRYNPTGAVLKLRLRIGHAQELTILCWSICPYSSLTASSAFQTKAACNTLLPHQKGRYQSVEKKGPTSLRRCQPFSTSPRHRRLDV